MCTGINIVDHGADREKTRHHASIFYEEDGKKYHVGFTFPGDHPRLQDDLTDGAEIEAMLAPVVALIEQGLDVGAHEWDGRDVLAFKPGPRTAPFMEAGRLLTREEFDCECNEVRHFLKTAEERVRKLRGTGPLRARPELNGEVAAQLMLAVRHIEDARMRMGKAIQYAGDGVSCYDKGEKPSDA